MAKSYTAQTFSVSTYLRAMEMSKVVVLGLEGENGLWITDPEVGVVTAIAANAAESPRESGEVASHGISFATVAHTADALTSNVYDK